MGFLFPHQNNNFHEQKRLFKDIYYGCRIGGGAAGGHF